MKVNHPLCLVGVNELSIDTETYGLKYEDELFSVQISTDTGKDYYYNLKDYPDSPWLKPITKDTLKRLLSSLSDFKGFVYMANASYDLQKLELFDILLPKAKIHCTHTMEALFFPGHKPKLSEYAPRYGLEKLDTVEDYIKKHNLYDPKSSYLGVTIPKKPRFDLVPWSVLSEYAMVDAQITLKIGQKQREKLEENTLNHTSLHLTKALHKINTFGVRLDYEYCKKMFEQHKKACFEILNSQKEGFSDGKLYLIKLFTEKRLTITYNQKTKEPIFNNEVLEQHKQLSEIEALLSYREHYKLYRSFYFNLLYYSHKRRLHVSLNTYGTRTARFSTTKPALQTLPSKNTEVKKALIPDPEHFFLELDYSGMEMRLAFDQAGEYKAIKNIKQGLDIHQETAKLVGSSRQDAKTTNFAKLYGSGVKRIAAQTGLPYLKAKELFQSIDEAYPKLKELNFKLQAQARTHGFIRNYYKRLLFIPKDKTYKALNYFIQSLGADIMRIAMLKIHNYIKKEGLKSRVVLSVHDSLLIQIPFSEIEHQHEFKNLMEQAYTPKSGLPMEVDAKHSSKSYGDLIESFMQKT